MSDAAMTEQVQGLEKGMRVQIRPESFLHMRSAWKQKMKGREGTILNFSRLPGEAEFKEARVKWHKKGGRGREFITFSALGQLQPVTTTPPSE